MATLDGAVALVEMHEIAVLVAEHLDFDVLRVFNVLLEKDRRVAKGRLGFGGGALQPFEELLLVARHTHAAPAAAGRGLDDDRIAGLLGEDQGLLFGGDRLGRPRHHRHPGRHRYLATGHLVAETAHDFRRRADEGDPGPVAGLGELGVLREEAVAGVDGVDVLSARQVDDLVDGEVGIDRPFPLADQVGLVGLVAVQREPVLLRVDRHGTDPQLGAGAEDANRDLAAVCCHDLLELPDLHQTSSRVVPLMAFLIKNKQMN